MTTKCRKCKGSGKGNDGRSTCIFCRGTGQDTVHKGPVTIKK